MPIKIIISILIITFFVGCSGKSNPYAKQEDTLHEQSLMQTKKRTFKNSQNEIVAYVVATYLNQVENTIIKADPNDTEVFLIGLYEGEKSSSDLLENIEFKIDGIQVGCYSPIEKENELLKLIPSGNPWMQYYLLYAPSVKERTISVEISIGENKVVNLSFQKDYI